MDSPPPRSLRDLLQVTSVSYRVIGDPDIVIAGIRSIDTAGPDHMSLAYGKRRESAATSRAAAIITDADDDYLRSLGSRATWIVTDQPRLLAAEVGHYFLPRVTTGIHPTASIDATARVASDVAIGPLATIGSGVTIGAGSRIHAGVHILHGVQIGERVTIGPGTVIGSDGFGYERTDGGWLHLPHLGTVIVHEDVEIGANTCIDRGTFSDTVIEAGAKIDNLIHIAHNVQIGRDAMVIANSMIGGSTSIGSGAWIAPSTSLINGIEVGDDAVTGLGAVVIRDVAAGTTVIGVPAKPLAPKPPQTPR
jgi:UDP-3-O-[3-hydroxymyristoyl] glucosamine N-acyltransferase